MSNSCHADLMQFLQTDLALSSAELAVLMRHPGIESASLPMLLWQYGLVSLEQLAQIFDWLEDQVVLNLDWIV